ncbi:MAG TPA: UPF0058 family protein [Candidatus Syntrophoarchaeum butanivorans]|uniref:Protein belonging to Uncharacterized protein family UPF0058 n=1 Tax=Candidatus Syntropharchaeum butanivorans TaxID=1839936 RepID=A0A1F2P4P2_9EURY|nr:MAG: protein belonging to Uncharacterized protein family UPF0058 [Candidatus Syntrophoarchaeum butanivorans]HDM36969.1 UPF0058 family protein [Candidatus Syntrophoarchaeum butanivorans]HEC56871.1 UPF0058 family protein [Candidatus Syntrophoarchaeum butanivorans]
MHKEELIQLHMFLVQLKDYFEKQGMTDSFNKYKELNISPLQIHRSKADHKRAIFTLSNEIASLVASDEFSGIARTAARMERLAKIDSK